MQQDTRTLLAHLVQMTRLRAPRMNVLFWPTEINVSYRVLTDTGADVIWVIDFAYSTHSTMTITEPKHTLRKVPHSFTTALFIVRRHGLPVILATMK